MLVGVLGKTTSGKCAIHKSLLRICELESGRVSIDGVDLNTLGLHFLRKSIAYIPPNPFFIQGTIRENLDTFSEATDSQIDAILREVNMYEKVYSLERNLDT